MTSDALSLLKDIHLPASVSIWPLADIWYVLFIVALVLGWLIGPKCWARWQRYRLQREALNELKEIARQGGGLGYAHLSMLLKRVSLALYPRDYVASLCGVTWLRFLDKSANMNYFEREGQILLSAPYQSVVSEDFDMVCYEVGRWVRLVCAPWQLFPTTLKGEKDV